MMGEFVVYKGQHSSCPSCINMAHSTSQSAESEAWDAYKGIAYR